MLLSPTSNKKRAPNYSTRSQTPPPPPPPVVPWINPGAKGTLSTYYYRGGSRKTTKDDEHSSSEGRYFTNPHYHRHGGAAHRTTATAVTSHHLHNPQSDPTRSQPGMKNNEGALSGREEQRSAAAPPPAPDARTQGRPGSEERRRRPNNQPNTPRKERREVTPPPPRPSSPKRTAMNATLLPEERRRAQSAPKRSHSSGRRDDVGGRGAVPSNPTAGKPSKAPTRRSVVSPLPLGGGGLDSMVSSAADLSVGDPIVIDLREFRPHYDPKQEENKTTASAARAAPHPSVKRSSPQNRSRTPPLHRRGSPRPVIELPHVPPTFLPAGAFSVFGVPPPPLETGKGLKNAKPSAWALSTDRTTIFSPPRRPIRRQKDASGTREHPTPTSNEETTEEEEGKTQSPPAVPRRLVGFDRWTGRPIEKISDAPTDEAGIAAQKELVRRLSRPKPLFVRAGGGSSSQ